ncbi:MFS transporter [Paenibacillus marinisediminis]
MNPGQELTNKRNRMLLIIIVFTGFLIFGFSENIKGPAIPRMQSDFSLDEMQLGLLLSLNSLGYLLACSFTGILSRKLGLKTVTMLAFGSMTLSGILIYYSVNYTFLSVSYFFMYVGNGMLEIGLALLAARVFTHNTGTMMSLSHFFYGLSSMVAPIIATYLMGVSVGGAELGWRGMYLIMISLAIIPMLPSIGAKFPKSTVEGSKPISMKQYVSDPAAWIIVMILSFGVVSELAVGSWLVNYLEKAYQWEASAASGMLSLFFFFFMMARLLFGPIIDKIGFTKSLIIFPVISGACSLGGILIGPSGAFLFALAGIGIAPIYPTVMALLAKRYPHGADMAITFTVTMMGIASVIGNFLVGWITDTFKQIFTSLHGAEKGLLIGLQAGYAFIAVCALICSVAAIILYRYDRKTHPAAVVM